MLVLLLLGPRVVEDVSSFPLRLPELLGGIAHAPGVYFLGLPWLTMRGSSFIWGVYQDAKHLAAYIEKSAAAAA